MDRKLPPEGRPVRKRNPRRNSTAQPESSHDQPLDVNPVSILDIARKRSTFTLQSQYNIFDVRAESSWDYHSAPGPSFHQDLARPGPSRPPEQPPYPHLPPVSSFTSYSSQMHPSHAYLPPEINMQDFLWHPPAPQFPENPYILQHQRPLYEPGSISYVPEQLPERPAPSAPSASSDYISHSYASLPLPPPSSTSATTPNSPEAESEPDSSHDKRRRNTIASGGLGSSSIHDPQLITGMRGSAFQNQEKTKIFESRTDSL